MIHLKRVTCNQYGTFGVLMKDNIPVCVTLEDMWKFNQQNVSCIPTGVYECADFSGAKFKNVWILKNVPDRSYILIHSGNTADDTHGCILVGDSFYEKGISGSKSAMNRLRKILPSNFTMTISNAWED